MFVLCMIILVFFAIIGLCAFITAILDIAYKGDSSAVLVIQNLKPDNAEARIRTAARICLHHTHIRLVCVCEESDPAYDICKLLQKEYPFMDIQNKLSVIE